MDAYMWFIAIVLVTAWIYWDGLQDAHRLECEDAAQYGEEGPPA